MYSFSLEFPYRVWLKLVLEIFEKKTVISLSLLSENQTRACFFKFFEQTIKRIFLKFFSYTELSGPGNKLLDVFRYV